MRSQGFKQGNAQIRGMREKETKKKINWDRIVYLTIVNLVLGALAFAFLRNYLFVSGEGQVIADRFFVRFPSDVRIQEMRTQKGDSVVQYDELFVYTPSFQTKSPVELETIRSEFQDRIFENALKVDEKLSQLKAIKMQMKHYRERISVIEQEIKLNLATPRLLYENEDRVVNLKADSINVLAEIVLLRNRNKYLESLSADEGLVLDIRDAELRGQVLTYQSPVTGVVEQVYKGNSELAVRTESIISIRRNSKDILVRALFSRDDLDYVYSGKVVTLRFDNGDLSKGMITNVYSSEYEQIGTVNRAGVLISDQIVVEIRPIEEQELALWETNSNISLKVETSIF